MERSKLYYETAPYGSGTWTEETAESKVRIVSGLNRPKFAEVTIVDHDHAIQTSSRYEAYKRVRIVDTNNDETTFLGVVEFIEASNDDELGPALVLQCRDFLSELEERTIDHDFSGSYNTYGRLAEAIITYYTYTEISYTNLAGGAFTVGNWIKVNGGTAQARIVYDDTTNDVLAVTDVIDDSAEFINTAHFDEYSDVDCTTATGVDADQTGAIARNIDPTSMPAAVACTTDDGNFSKSTLSVLKALEYMAVQSAGYDFYLTNGTSPTFYPQVVQWFERGTLPAGGPAANGLTLEYNPTTVTDQVKPYFSNYKFPIPEREQLSQIIVRGVDENNAIITSSWASGANGAVAYDNKRFKFRVTQRYEIADQTTLNSAATQIKNKTDSTVQRGDINIQGYPYFTITGTDYVVNAGDTIHLHNSRLSSVHNVDFLVVEISYEEPPGFSAIKLCLTTEGISFPEYTYPVPHPSTIDVTEININSELSDIFLPITIDIDFTAVDDDDITWTAGTITSAGGSVWSTNAGGLNLANANPYYIYFQIGNADLQNTQTFGNAVGDDKALVAFALKATDSNEKATIVPGTRSNLPVIAADSIFVYQLSAITANMGLLTAGEIRVGTGTLGVDFTGWRLYVSGGVGIIAGYDSDTQQWYTDTNGKLNAGGGDVVLDVDGLSLYGQGRLRFYEGTTKIAVIDCVSDTLYITSYDDSASEYKDIVMAGNVVWELGHVKIPDTLEIPIEA